MPTHRQPRRATAAATLVLALALPTLVLAPGLAAEEPPASVEERLEALEERQQELEKQVRSLRQQLARQAPKPVGPDVAGVEIDLGDNPVRGEAGARLTLVEFTDIQCPFCARHQSQTLPRIEEEYVATGKLRYVTMDMPLERIHRQAFKAAEAAHCAGEQGKFFEMHERLFAHQKSLEPWSAHAEALELDVKEFESCMESDQFADSVRHDMEQARKAGASATPSFVLALTDPEDPTRVEGLSFIRGAQPFPAFEREIEKALGELEEGGGEAPSS